MHFSTLLPVSLALLTVTSAQRVPGLFRRQSDSCTPYETCLSPDGIYTTCYDTSAGDECCSDGAVCNAGYYCGTGRNVAYCCPDVSEIFAQQPYSAQAEQMPQFLTISTGHHRNRVLQCPSRRHGDSSRRSHGDRLDHCHDERFLPHVNGFSLYPDGKRALKHAKFFQRLRSIFW